jgi:hypothetical protein
MSEKNVDNPTAHSSGKPQRILGHGLNGSSRVSTTPEEIESEEAGIGLMPFCLYKERGDRKNAMLLRTGVKQNPSFDSKEIVPLKQDVYLRTGDSKCKLVTSFFYMA